MVTKLKLILILLLPLVLLSSSQCSSESKLMETIPVSAFIDECPDRYYDFGEMVTVGDPNERFVIRLPYSWDIRESYSDSLYGVFASNFLSIPKPAEDQMSLAVSGYNSKKELEDYFYDELLELQKSDNTAILERGNTMLGDNETPWVLFEMSAGIYVMVFYVKDADKEDVYLIQSISYDTVNYRVKFCYLKQLINTFELIK